MEKELSQLESLLLKQIAAHEQLSALLKRQLASLRQADQNDVAACCELENQQVQAIAEMEKERLTLVAGLTLAVEPAARQPLGMGALAERLPEPLRGRLLVLREQLRQRMQSVRNDTGVARRAAEALVAHMHGLVQTIGACVTGVGVYCRGGALPKAASAVSTFQATA